MKRGLVFVLTLAVLIFSGSYRADAQMSCCGGGMQGGMMGGGMMLHGMPPGMSGCGCGMMGMMGHGGGMKGIQSMWASLLHLNLSDAQKTSIKKIRDAALTDMIRKKSDLQVAMFELHNLLDNDPVNMAAVESKLKQVEGLRTSMRFAGIKAIEDMKAQLTPDQRKKLNGMMEGGSCGMGMGMMHKGMGQGMERGTDTQMQRGMEQNQEPDEETGAPEESDSNTTL